MYGNVLENYATFVAVIFL